MSVLCRYRSSRGRTTSALRHNRSFVRPYQALWLKSCIIFISSFLWFCIKFFSPKVFMKLINSWIVYVFLNVFFYLLFISDSTAFSSSNPHAFQINFNSLYTALCEQQKSDQATLLLYTLLHQNSNVRTYVLARTDIENLVSIVSLQEWDAKHIYAVKYNIYQAPRLWFPLSLDSPGHGVKKLVADIILFIIVFFLF